MKNNRTATFISLVLIMSMLAMSFTGCGSKPGAGSSALSESESVAASVADAKEGANDGANEGEKPAALYTNENIGEGVLMSEAIHAYYDAVDENYAYELAKELAYNWDELGDFLGWRSAGSDAEHATADYLAKEMEALGLQNVEKVGTPCDKFQFNGSSLKIADTDICYDSGEQSAAEQGMAAPAAYHVNGTNGEITTEIIDLGTGHEEEYEGVDAAGKIGLVQVDQMNESWINGYMEMAAEKGLAALVTWSESGYGEAGDFTVNVQDVCCSDLLPTVAISAKQAKAIKAAIEEGHDQCTFNLDTEMVDNGGTTYNVCGMIPGKNHEQKIIISGHYDKYWYGFQDDCLAMGLVFGVARAFLNSGYVPENDIYFIAHGAEEWGATDTPYDWTTGAWGMVDDEQMGDGVLAMINTELPAVKTESGMTISSVPEFYALKNRLFEDKVVVTSGAAGFDTGDYAVSTMEDGISYREYGVPYFVNGFEGSDFLSQRYHTIADSDETYDADTFITNLNWYGAFAIYTDVMPALELDLAQTAVELENALSADYAAEAGVSKEAYGSAVKTLKDAAAAMNTRIADCNTTYAEAVASGDKESAAKARTEGAALNEKSLAAFQAAQDAFLKVSDFGADYGHTSENYNVKCLDGILAALDEGVIWADDGESGAADNAWCLNTQLEWMYGIFSMDAGDKEIASHTQAYFADKDQAQWSWKHFPTVTETGALSYELMHAESIEDIEDLDAMKAGYADARKAQIEAIGEWCEKEMEAMEKIAEMLE